ncbi:MAG: diguanylate cyclase [Armatimonadetes bacterium]|nr:diguanylate cyclase [Armatimonadota bacterium]
MTGGKNNLGLKYRAVFYAFGVAFGTASYIVGLLAFGMESASWGDLELYKHLLRDLIFSFRSHSLSFFIWLIICTAISGVIGHLFDQEVYHRRKAEIRANIDGVTEIYNHRYFQERLCAEIERASRYGRTLSVIMLDLDNFKSFNDTWGHQEGDRLLKWFATVCDKCIRNIDVLARYGGEEFVVILPETDTKEALDVAERIRHSTQKQSQTVFGRNKVTTVSAGVASYPQHAQTHHALVLNADAALYYAKQRGKNCCFVYEEECHRSYRVTAGHIQPLLRDDDMEAMEALAAAADAKDSHMKGHSMSVMRMAVTLGEGLSMSAEEMSNLRAAALLHDLGRIGTPEEILSKPGPLASEEWKKIENHAKLGSRILKHVQQMGSIVPGVKHHHERYDGKGYPNGLSGKNIPLLARIIAIADAYDAMTSARSYREALSTEEAIEELRRGSGNQFDPDLVKTFIAQLKAGAAKDEAA